MSVVSEQLRVRWAELAKTVPPLATLPEAPDDLLRRHGEPHRHYHTGAHVLAVLRTLDDLTQPITPKPAFQLAAWFHDAVYDPAEPDNEHRSARLAEQCLATALPPEDLRTVAELIRATAGHRLVDIDGCAVFLDADLAILGADPQTYTQYATAIRREYTHLSEAAYRTGRIHVLSEFLARDRLFFTATAHARWDGAARVNLRTELASLSA